jgi:hypothetical protein
LLKAHTASVKDIAARLLAHRKIDRPGTCSIVIGRRGITARETCRARRRAHLSHSIETPYFPFVPLRSARPQLFLPTTLPCCLSKPA